MSAALDETFASVIVCTRDRGDSIVGTIASILASTHRNFELIIIDQSSSDETQHVVADRFSDDRIRFVRVSDAGVSRSRNRGLRLARSEFVLSTDDDCAVDANWIEENVRALEDDARPGVVYADVRGMPDPDGGYVPESVADADVLLRDVRDWRSSSDGVNVGIGASMAVRRSVAHEVGGFDVDLGPGSELRNAEDTDLALRILLAGHPVRRLISTGVDHHGARTPEEFRTLTRHAARGLGAMAGKLARRRPRRMVPFLCRLYWNLVLADVGRSLRRRKIPRVLGRAVYLTRGVGIGLTRQSSRDSLCFSPPSPSVGFVTERQVGLRTYSDNLERFVVVDDRIQSTFHPIEYRVGSTRFDRLRMVPESVLGSLRGRAEVRRSLRSDADAHLFLTQTPVALGGRLARRRPYVVMVDDTPRLYDDMAVHYGENADRGGPIAAWKHRANIRGLRGAHAVVPMSDWARRSLIDDYGVADDRIVVIATGLDLDEWTVGEAVPGAMPRILFVGGDFERKGGPLLIDAFDELRGRAELDIVTRSEVEPQEGVRVHRGLGPNSPELRRLYAECDIFVLASMAEAFPNVIVEASASGLPCVVSDVGAMGEMIVEGETGFVVPPADADALASRLADLVDDHELRAQMSAAARRHAERHFDGDVNSKRVVDLLLAALDDS
ncbi:glycosyltransferase [Ilumatobacter coccineus]|uniref:Putative glycosyltransferase n=1 Tax=Ilumatobacter coccineus (strain NBRC 103263 / KCTC 29153 / YM16-304) TaxID=1313172 RepID=A0A6C7ECL0_ILUCY|nr:glycosyltransferase [Ilumatobacter coccineus]BAN01746.1 putative glycosyltransferase [Ilumatobacter coccineus YM16-304]